MPQLPDPTGMARRIPSGQRAIASADASVIGRAVSDIGGTVFKLGQQQADKQDRYDLARAKSKWISARSDAESSFDGDKEFGTMENRYRDGLVKQMDDIGGGIRNSQLREEFRLQQQSDLEIGSNRIQAKAFVIEKDHHKGLLIDDLNSLRESALKMNSAEAIETMQERIDAASEMGYLSDTEAATLRQKNAVDYSISRIEMAPASERDGLLKGPLGKYVPSDKAQDISDRAKAERVDNESMLTVDMWMAEGLSLEQGMTEASKIRDPDVRKATEQRFKLQYQVEKKAVQDASNDLYEQKVDLIEQGQWSYDQLTNKERETLTGVQQANLKKIYTDKVTGTERKTTNLDAFDDVTRLLQVGRHEDARQYVMDNRTLFTSTDSKKFIDDAVTGMGDSFYDTQKQLDLTLASNGITDKGKKATLQLQLSKMRDGYRALNNGKEPDQDRLNKMVKELVSEWDGPRWWDVPLYKEIQEGVISIDELLLRDEPKANIKKARDEFIKQRGQEPTPEEFFRWYTSAKKRGLL